MIAELNPVSTVDVQSIMREIRADIRGNSREREWLRHARKAVPAHLMSSVGRLRASTAGLRSAIARIGDTPPAPATVRGKIGGALIALMRRALFWYTPGIQSVNYQLLDALEAHVKATEEIIQILERTSVDLARINDRNQLRASSNSDCEPSAVSREHTAQ